MPPQRTWKVLVNEVVRHLPRTFSLADITARKEYFQRHYPDNRFIEAKIRQSLQVLRDQGTLKFLGRGRYQTIGGQSKFSPLIDPTTATAYTSRTQVGRVMLETWAELNLFCVNCAADALSRLPANTPVADFVCGSCEDRYQLKAKDGRFGSLIPGAAYGPTLKAIRNSRMPEYVLVEYDPRFHTVVFVDAIPGRLITEDRVRARKKLGPTARRAGWQGCNIDVSELPRVRIVEPAGLERTEVRADWRRINES
jgi:hypothetical protein